MPSTYKFRVSKLNRTKTRTAMKIQKNLNLQTVIFSQNHSLQFLQVIWQKMVKIACNYKKVKKFYHKRMKIAEFNWFQMSDPVILCKIEDVYMPIFRLPQTTFKPTKVCMPLSHSHHNHHQHHHHSNLTDDDLQRHMDSKKHW